MNPIFQHPDAGTGEPVLQLWDALPQLVCRLDSEAIAEVEGELERLGRAPTSIGAGLESPHPYVERQYELWRDLLEVLERVQARWRVVREQFDNFAAEYFDQVTTAGQRSVMTAYLREHSEANREFREDREALDDYLDFDVLRERHRDRLNALERRIRVVLLGLEAVSQDALGRLAAGDREKVAAEFRELMVGKDRLRIYLSEEAIDTVRVEGLAAMSPVVSTLLASNLESVPSDWMRHLIRLASTPTDSSWIQIAVLRMLAHDPQTAGELLEKRFMTATDMDDDWQVRAHAGRLGLEYCPHAFLELLEGGPAPMETSDGIAMEVAETLGDLDHPRAIDLLEGLAADDEEARPKVRAQALRALVDHAGRGGERGARAASLIAGALREEPVSWVIGCVYERLDDLLDELDRDDGGAEQAAELLREVLADRLMREPDAEMANRIARIRLRLAEHLGEAIGEEWADLVGRLSRLTKGESLDVTEDEADEEALVRAMARVAEHGYGLYARRRRGGWRVRRGEDYRSRLWRILHELRNPSPSKRQGYYHARGRVYEGPIRAHPRRMGEVTPTEVPGERRQIGEEGGWGPYVPLVDDLLDAQLAWRPIQIATRPGVTNLAPPGSWLKRVWNFLVVSWRYEELDRLRNSSLDSADQFERSKYLAKLEETFGMTIGFEPHFDDEPVPQHAIDVFSRTTEGPKLPDEQVELLEDRSSVFAVVALLGYSIREIGETARQAIYEVFNLGGSRILDLVVLLAVVLTLFLGRLSFARYRIERARNDVPLCIGGWGSRGKSGTERLKAGLFQGLGWDVVVKTTGCEAMVIHGVPGEQAREIFLYRPYDKATIWEQAETVQLGANLDCDVFLWECMALNNRYADILQSQWMNDDLVTLTNAYPDHEDIQGPAGIDVAKTIGTFLPEDSEAITTEREMLPVFKKLAREKNTNLQTVGEASEYLLSDDAYDRFPYDEHPRNIALVTQMADHLGVEREYAIFQMADNVVPDLGVLKRYPEVRFLGRDVSFIVGNSANERAGFMSNWERLGLDRVDPGEDPSERVVTVVNNRYDRIARSKVFADILVRDVAADRHLLIGTGLPGLKNYLEDSLTDLLDNLQVFPDEVDDELDVATTRRRLEEVTARVRLTNYGDEQLVDFLATMVEGCGASFPDGARERAEAIVERAMARGLEPGESLEAFRESVRELEAFDGLVEAVEAADGEADGALQTAGEGEVEHADRIRELGEAETHEVWGFWLEALGTTAGHRRLEADAEAVIDGELDAGEFRGRLHALYRERFWELVETVDDPSVSGDYIIRDATEQVPPGAEASLLGCQNIKGTGLDLVYRWVELDQTLARIDELSQVSSDEFVEAMRDFEGRTSFGLLEVLEGWRRLTELGAERKTTLMESTVLDRVREHFGELCGERWAEIAKDGGDDEQNPWKTKLLEVAETMLEPLDAIRRRRKADRLREEFVADRISRTRMAIQMQKLVKRQKGGWLVDKYT
jgi:poly-gamma-glutamate synthase PgsB/CapB